MVTTRGKKKPASSNRTLEDEAAENALAEGPTSDAVGTNVALDDEVDIAVDKEKNESIEGTSGQEAVDDDQNVVVAELNVDSNAELEENTSEDDEIDDQEDMLWAADQENIDHNNEERVVEEYDFSDEDATEEDNEDDEVSEEEATEDEDEVYEEEEDIEENSPNEKEIVKQDATEAKAEEDENAAGKHNADKLEVSLTKIKKSSERSKMKKALADRSKKEDLKDKPESSLKRKLKKRVESMGMIFMCSSKTKKDCYKYRVLGLPESKKELVEKIYTGMRLFLYDVDLKLMYGIYKAAGPGGYNIEPKAFKSQFPSQVRFKVLDNCMPLAEEKFKKVIEDNYYTKNKFDCKLNSVQVKELCKLFISSSKGRSTELPIRSRKEGKKPVRQEKTRKRRAVEGAHLPLREEVQHRAHYRNRMLPRKAIISPVAPPRQRLPPRKAIINPVAPPRQRLPPALPSTVSPPYVYERTSDVDAYRRDPYYGDRRVRPLSRHVPYRDGGDPYLDRHHVRDPYRDDRDTYPRHHNPYRDEQNPYPELPDLYRGRQDPYIERHDRDPYIERHDRDSYRDGRDSYLEHQPLYRDTARSELYDTYRKDPLSDSLNVYREDRGVEYRESYRREDLLGRRDIAGRNYYVSTRERDPIYPEDYPSRAGVYRL